MTHIIELTDEQYDALQSAAEARGETPATVLASLFEQIRDPYMRPRYLQTDDFLRHLGASEEEIEELNREVAADEAEEASTRADS